MSPLSDDSGLHRRRPDISLPSGLILSEAALARIVPTLGYAGHLVYNRP